MLWESKPHLTKGHWGAFIDAIIEVDADPRLLTWNLVTPYEPPTQIKAAPVVEPAQVKPASISWFAGLKTWFNNLFRSFSWPKFSNKDSGSESDSPESPARSIDSDSHHSADLIPPVQNLSYVTRILTPSLPKPKARVWEVPPKHREPREPGTVIHRSKNVI